MRKSGSFAECLVAIMRFCCICRSSDRDVGSSGELQHHCERTEAAFWGNESCEWKMGEHQIFYV